MFLGARQLQKLYYLALFNYKKLYISSFKRMIEDTTNTKLNSEAAVCFLDEMLFSDISISVDFDTAYKFSWNRQRQRKKKRVKRFFF